MSPATFHQRIVRERERREITGVPTSTWYDLQDKGLAPMPVPVVGRTVGWLLSELLQFIEERVNARDNDWQPVSDITRLKQELAAAPTRKDCAEIWEAAAPLRAQLSSRRLEELSEFAQDEIQAKRPDD